MSSVLIWCDCLNNRRLIIRMINKCRPCSSGSNSNSNLCGWIKIPSRVSHWNRTTSSYKKVKLTNTLLFPHVKTYIFKLRFANNSNDMIFANAIVRTRNRLVNLTFSYVQWNELGRTIFFFLLSSARCRVSKTTTAARNYTPSTKIRVVPLNEKLYHYDHVGRFFFPIRTDGKVNCPSTGCSVEHRVER